MEILNKKPRLLNDTPMHYCPGCSHGIVHRLVAEALEELGQTENVIGVMPVGCAVFGYNYFNCDMFQAAHGRAMAVATAAKRVKPDNIVFSYQGDGDLCSIGMAESVHAALRGENITVIFINNGIYGMTGGQMAPTTMEGVKATTCPNGRDRKLNGNPIKMSEMLATLDGPAYIERTACNTPANVRKTKAAIKKGFEYQIAKKGFSIIEVLCTCPTNYAMTPLKAQEFVTNRAIEFYPLGVYKDIGKEGK